MPASPGPVRSTVPAVCGVLCVVCGHRGMCSYMISTCRLACTCALLPRPDSPGMALSQAPVTLLQRKAGDPEKEGKVAFSSEYAQGFPDWKDWRQKRPHEGPSKYVPRDYSPLELFPYMGPNNTYAPWAEVVFLRTCLVFCVSCV